MLYALQQAWKAMDIEQDPYVIKLQRERRYDKIAQVVLKKGTFCQERMKKFCNAALHIFEELGHWAVEYFIATAITSFTRAAQAPKMGVTQSELELSTEEKQYLLSILQLVPLKRNSRLDNLSQKTWVLLRRLSNLTPAMSGIIFVQQRATVAILQELLTVHPLTSKLKCGTFMGTSNNAAKKAEIGEFIDIKHQQRTIEDFRDRKYNLIIATSVLEEGIDIPACSLVICHQKPQNLKSFIQRRGRARQMSATFVIMLQDNDAATSDRDWEDLERLMIQQYMDDTRKAQEIAELEADDETSDMRFKTNAGAVLTFDYAIAHLYHFCAKVCNRLDVDHKPIFTFEERNMKLRATVTLPSGFDESLRQAQGQLWWLTEKAAKKDAAFQAYRALYNAGLVNEHVLPSEGPEATKVQELETEEIEREFKDLEVPSQIDPWRALSSDPDWHETSLTIKSPTAEIVTVKLILPARIARRRSIDLNMSDGEVLIAELGPTTNIEQPPELSDLRSCTETILRSIHGKNMELGIVPLILIDPLPHGMSLAAWNDSVQGVVPAVERITEGIDKREFGILRDTLYHDARYWPLAYDAATSTFEGGRFTHRRDFQALPPSVYATKDVQLSAQQCTMEKLPSRFTLLSLSLPTILHSVESHVMAHRLSQIVLPSVPFRSLDLIATALTATSANHLDNYQRLEFLGDCILKYITSVQLFYQYNRHPERLLTEMRSRIISNSRLTKAAISADLSAFIVRDHLTRHWRPPGYRQEKSPQLVSPKLLADVVEALIGAAYHDGGISSATACARVFLPEIESIEVLPPPPSYLNDEDPWLAEAGLEELIGYAFRHPRILSEARTHPQYNIDVKIQSYQRLEFLGDAVLDRVVADSLFGMKRSQSDMTLIKAAMVNADLLAYLCLNCSVTSRYEKALSTGPRSFSTQPEQEERHLWSFMRFLYNDVGHNRDECVKRFALLRDSLIEALNGEIYPWAILARLGAPKFFSDLIESVLGAIFVDSAGDITSCKLFLSRIGFMELLERLVKHIDIDLLHPKTRLGIAANTKRVDYVCNREKDTGWKCVVKIEGEDTAVAEGCAFQEEAVCIAADEATQILREK